MRIIRDYTCDICGATEEHFSDSERVIEYDVRPHYECLGGFGVLHAVLSPTATTFRYADSSARKVARG